MTAVGVVDMLVTEFTVFKIENGEMSMLEIAPEVTLEQIKENTAAEYKVADNLAVYKGSEAA